MGRLCDNIRLRTGYKNTLWARDVGMIWEIEENGRYELRGEREVWSLTLFGISPAGTMSPTTGKFEEISGQRACTSSP